MKHVVALMVLTVSFISLFGCARKGEVVQEQAGKFREELQELTEDETIDAAEPPESENIPNKLERLNKATIPKEIMELFDNGIDEKNVIYYTVDAAKKLECKEEQKIVDRAELSTKYSDNFDKENREEITLLIGSALDIRAGGEARVYVPVETKDLIQGNLKDEKVLVSRGVTLKTDSCGNEYFESIGSNDLDEIMLTQKLALYVLKQNSEGKNHYFCSIPVINLPTDYKDFDEEYVSELLDYYRGKQYKSEENKESTKTEDGEVIYHFSWNPYEQYENYTDEQMLELLEDQLLVQIALRYKIKIRPQDNPMLSKLDLD